MTPASPSPAWGRDTSLHDVAARYEAGSLSTADAIAELERRARRPLSAGQRGLWALHRMEPDTYSYNVPVALSCEDVDHGALEAALRDTVSAHPVLAATATGDGLSPGSPDSMRVDLADIADVPSEDVTAHLAARAREPFDLTRGPLVRLSVLTRTASEVYVLLVAHHLVLDGPSMCLLLDTLLDAYRARVSGREPPAPPASAPYDAFVAREQEYLGGERAAADREYWTRELAGSVPLTGLPTGPALAPDAPHEGAVLTRGLSAERAGAVAAFSAEYGVVPSVVLLAVFTTLLHRWTGQDDVVVGMPVSGRPPEGFDGTVGYFINTLPVRSRPSGTDRFAAFAERLQATVFDAVEHGAYPFGHIVRDVAGPAADRRSPLFGVVVNYQNFSLSGHLDGLADRMHDVWPFRPVDGLHQLGEFDLTLDVVPGDGVALHWKYHPRLWSEDTVARMADQFAALVDAVVEPGGGDVELGRLNLLDPDGRELVVHGWNRTDADYPADRTVRELVADQAAARPDAMAVSCGDETLTYRELDERATALAATLRHRGVRVGDRVGVCLERSADLVVALLAVMEAGAAYVPLDPELPAERLAYMVDDSGSGLVVCHGSVRDRLSTVDPSALFTMDGADGAAAGPGPSGEDARPATDALPVYVMYTSGSTGRPKGVVVPHRALTNLVLSIGRTLGASADVRTMAVATYGFDIAALEMFLPLVSGGCCRIPDAATVRDATLLAAEVDAWRPTVLQATPVTWAMLLRVGWRNEHGATLITTGEAVPPALRDHLVALGETWNLYGPTETTLYASAKRLDADGPVTIGSPVANTQLHVVDAGLRPVPVGVPGELCIAGHGVALGYHGRPELTAERFVDDPFHDGGRLYRTGDVARRLPDGEIVVLGRTDDQVKLRGHRIEPGEIETALDGHPDVVRSVVVVERDVRSDRLVAYLTAHGDVDAGALREHLGRTLPAHMVPSAFVALESFPLNANGKIDRSRLAGAGRPSTPEPSTADVSDVHVERTVRRIFCDVLGRTDVVRDEGFFEAGGDSFTAIDVVEELNRAFGCDLRPTALFAHASVAAMARHVGGLAPGPGRSASSGRDPAPSAPGRERAPSAAGREGTSAARAESGHAGGDAYLDDSIAVVGLSCRFPGAADHREFWRNLRDGIAGSTTWSPDELRALGVPDELAGRPGFVPHRAVVEDKAEFDPSFFGLSPRDAELMDPQGRLLLMHAWRALEDAGQRPEDAPDTSVHTATSANFYQALLPALMDNASGPRVLASTDAYAAWLMAQGGTVPTMISTKLGLSGPSMAVGTNCSSALTAVHLACRGLLSGETDRALVGAASLCSTMELGYVHHPGLNLSGDGVCRAFDDAADGMTGGEGVGVVVLKRARDAIADGDHVYCLVRGTAVNNDGGDKAGFYAPGVPGQAAVVRSALERSGVDPATIRYVEAHGTGTRLGDPVEVAALTEAYRQYTDRTRYCGIGSVKSSIGHLDAAAGIAGLIALALGLHHGEIPATRNVDVPNTSVDWASSPFFVAGRNLPLDGDGPARAGLSSFGVGGTNVHAVLEQAPPRTTASGVEGPQLVVLSARDRDRLAVRARDLAAFLPEYGGDLASLAHTLRAGRRAMDARVAFVAADLDALAEALTSYAGGTVPDGAFEGTVRAPGDELVSLFDRTGQLRELAAQWVERGEWDHVAPLWVSGVDVDWTPIHGASPPPRVSLPTYPFATSRYWPEPAQRPDRPATDFGGATPDRATRPTPGDDGPAGGAPDGTAEADALLTAAAGAEGVDRFLERRRDTAAGMDAVLRRLLLAQLWSAGLFREPVTRDRAGAGVVEARHAAWFDRCVADLLGGGELVADGDIVRVPGAPDVERAWRDWREWTDAHADDPELAAKVAVTERTVEAIPAILAGETTPTAVLFPGGSFALVEAVYRDNVASDYFNRVLAGTVRSEVDGRGSGVRILEVGAGTGSASAWVFDRLADVASDVEEYCYTDVSKAFLIEAERRFAARVPYLTYRVLDVERPPSAQGLQEGRYDVVVANNVLHATRDITETLANVRALLRPGGVLVLDELAANEFWGHLAFGFLEGWFRHADDRRIGGGPALSAGSWDDVLRETGFDAVRFPTARAGPLGLQIVVARAAGPAATAPDEPIGEFVGAELARCLTASLKLRDGELDDDRPFADYGLDSLTGVGLVQMLGDALGTALDSSVLFDNPSIRRLTRHLVERHGDVIAAHRRATGNAGPPPSTGAPESTAGPDADPAPQLTNPATAIAASPGASPAGPSPTGASPTGASPAGATPTGAARTGVVPAPPDAHRTPEPVPAAGTARVAAPGSREPVAIIGMSGRFPGARDLDEFWRRMADGDDPITPVTRWDLTGRSTCLHGGFMDGIDEFDPLFFGISGLEAGYMEPQQRLFLQEAWNALEDAGHAGSGSFDRERCGIYVGSGGGDWFDLTTPTAYPAQAYWGNMNSMVPARLAYHLDLHGPAMTVNTACSSSLMAVHLACQGLWTGEADLALAGGVAVQCSPRTFVAGSRAGMLARSGRCRSFDAAADGFVPSEGVGVLVLKRLPDAQADGDHVHGVIRGIGVNQDGTSNGITAPNGTSQEQLIRRIHREFGIDPETIGMVEAHGTGTKLGDPVEFNALARAFRASTSREGFCSLGSVKANIGHALEAAGVAGIITVLLAMRHATLPGLMHHRAANPGVALAGSPFYVHPEPRAWAAPDGGRRRAAVTSLGASGTNVHAVIEQGPDVHRHAAPEGPRLVVLSAKTAEALREQRTRLADHLRRHPDVDLADVSHTLLAGRSHFAHRWACVAHDAADLGRRLDDDAPAPASGSAESRVAAEFLGGDTPAFDELFADRRYRRVPLPGYPFERALHPLPIDALPDAAAPGAAATDGPRTDDVPRAGATPVDVLLTGDEFHLRDHRVRGTAVVPGAMYLNWACAAAGTDRVRLQDVAFLRPLDVTGGPRSVRAAVGDGDRVEVGSTGPDGGEPLVHCQCRVAGEPVAPQALDLPAMLRDHRRSDIGPDRFYTDYRELGVDYGPAFRSVVAVHERDGSVLAELALPDAVASTAGEFAVHPSLVDGAMQCMRLIDDPGDGHGLAFSVRTVDVLAPCPTAVWAWLRRDGAGRVDIDLADPDGRVCLALRGVVVRRTGADDRTSAVTLLPVWDPVGEHRAPGNVPVPGANGQRAADDPPDAGLRRETAAPAPGPWPAPSERVAIVAASQRARDLLAARYPSAHVVSGDGSPSELDSAVAAVPGLEHVVWVAPESTEDPPADAMTDGQSTGTLQVVRLVTALLAAGHGGRPLVVTLVTQRAHAVHDADTVDPTHAGVAGVAGSLAKEYPGWAVRAADVDAYDAASLSTVLELPADPDGNLRVLRDGRWYRRRFLPVQSGPVGGRLPGGATWVVLGGAGGLGRAITAYLVRRHRAQVVWLGRRPLDARIEADLAAAAAPDGPAPVYVRADATDAGSLRRAHDEIERRFGRVHGVVHSGLVTSGGSLASASEQDFRDVLRSKVDASVRLLEVFGGAVDTVLFLSSINSYLAAMKQADYAAACTFMDEFAGTVGRRYGCTAKVLNLGYTFTNAERGPLAGADVPLVRADEVTDAIELLYASSTTRLTLMTFGAGLSTRGIEVADDEAVVLAQESALRAAGAVPDGPREDLARLRDRTRDLTALTI